MANSRFISNGIADDLRSVFSNARNCVLVAPFITQQGLKKLLDIIPASSKLTIFTRWRPLEVASGVSDPLILPIVIARGGVVRILDSLHAKVYMADDRIAFIGSANLTERGLGVTINSNVEAMAVISPLPSALFIFIRRLFAFSVVANENFMYRILEAAKIIRPATEVIGVEPFFPLEARWDSFPRLRSPERLFELYRDLASASTRDERDQALDDLAMLNLPEGLPVTDFNSVVAKQLEENLLVADLSKFLDRPRRFGEITDGLKTRRAYDNHKMTQRHAQNIIRWLVHFVPWHFRRGQPKYTETLERIGE